MLHRSTSSRRRRASRNVVNSAQGSSSVSGPRGRRASVAADKTAPLALTTPNASMERHRSPRGSMVPNIELDVENDSPEEPAGQRMLPDPELSISSQRNLVPDLNRSPRNSLIPDDYCRDPRGSLVPDPGRSPRNSLVPDIGRSPRNSLVPEVSRSPRHSLIPDVPLSPRNSLVPDVSYNRSPRNSLVPTGSSRSSLMPENNGGSRSPRHSLVPDPSRSPRGSVANIEFDRSPRGSMCPEVLKTPRGSITPLEFNRSPRGSIASDCFNPSSRGSIAPDPSRSPRGSIAPDPNRSPRGSIGPDPNRSPRGSICPEINRSPRGSIGPHDPNRSPRGSIGILEIERGRRESAGGLSEDETRSPRGSIGPELDRSPRGSIGGSQDRRSPRGSLAFQDPRRASADQGSMKNRSSSPYRQRDINSGSIRSGGSCGAQVNLGYGTNAWADSRRASSSVSQFSGDESRRLCGGSVSLTEKGTSGVGPLGVATYGSLAFQLKDAHLEASGTCDFVFRALGVVSKTLVVTICLGCLSTMPLLMLIMGLQFIRDCPKEPHIPVYMVVGGTLGSVRMLWGLYSQIRSRRPEGLSVRSARSHMSPTRLASMALTCFLAGWFVLGKSFW
ncbi:serine/arginine repetitive matrix protein 2 isoform X2 [Cephus cinctus]|uniref:Serine/arginine repetitive matrix protein 2 isoform X2 n=1 Tax=Cephus cinctus TaxID=211228 RepID=A0AAJ7FV07_CEPCN|nr:serine/arginine repetitive matrix protein 2 isoform X2 [Cephus cinctus]